MTGIARQIAKRYASVADAYDRLWAPILRHFSEPLIDALALRAGEQVADIGCGTGAISSVLAARTGRPAVGVDRTHEMISLAAAGMIRRVVGDARRIPLADDGLDAVVCTFALQHIPTAGTVAREAARILRPGGRYGTATWSPDHGEAGGVYDALQRIFETHGVPPDLAAARTWHDRVDDPRKVARIARRSGFHEVSAWSERRTYDWTPDAFVEWATTMGPWGRRLESVGQSVREGVTEALRGAVRTATRADLQWSTRLVYCIATSDPPTDPA